MKKIKVVTVLGTRPEIIRLSRLINILDQNFNHILINTQQNYDQDLNKIFFKDMSIRLADYNFKNKKISPVNHVSTILNEIEKILLKEKPSAFIILGDTNSSMSAYVAKRLKIPIFHIEAGNRCFDERVPEEINRKIVDHISDINITYSKVAKNNLLKENISQDTVFHLGSPLHEVFNFYESKISGSRILSKLNLKSKNYYLVSIHRDENVEIVKNFKKVIKFLKYLDSKKIKIIFSMHPRTMKKLKKIKITFKNILFSRPFAYSDYIYLQKNAKVVFSDSGSLTEEASLLHFNAINLRNTNERQEGVNKGIAPMIHFDLQKIQSILDFYKNNNLTDSVTEYHSPNFSKIFYKLVISYIDYVNKKYKD
jgi:UDP-N-acetylglucosamine 2-epimerase